MAAKSRDAVIRSVQNAAVRINGSFRECDLSDFPKLECPEKAASSWNEYGKDQMLGHSQWRPGSNSNIVDSALLGALSLTSW